MSTSESEAVRFAAPPADQVLDLVGDPAHHDLALFMHGNQWMVMERLLDTFRRTYPAVQNVYYETLPPDILVQQLQRGALQFGALTLRVLPDVLAAGMEVLARLAEEGWLDEYHEHAINALAILVARGNPHGIHDWAGLLQPDVRVVLPDPQGGGMGRLVREAVTDRLGSEAWAELGRRQARGQVRYTAIHHRQAPLALLEGSADAGPVWLTGALQQERQGAPLEVVRLPEGENRRSHLGVAVVRRTSQHPEAARAFAEFLLGPQAQAIYASYGFEQPEAVRIRT